MWVITMLILILCFYLFGWVLRLRITAPDTRVAKAPNPALPIVRRSYTYGQERTAAATVPESNQTAGSDVSFADGSEKENDSADSLPAWEVLQSGPVMVLGPQNEDGTPNEYLVPPPEIIPEKDEPEDLWGVVDGDPEEEPSVTDLTDEEMQALERFDVRAFR